MKISKILLAAAILRLAVFANVTVLESTPSRLVLQWEMSGFDTASVVSGGAQRTRVLLDGGFMFTGDSGASILPGYPIHVGVPHSGVPRAVVEPVELSPFRVGNPVEKRDFPVEPTDPVFRSRWISEPSYNAMRDYRSARFVLRPVFEVGPGRLQLLKKARIVIDIPPSPHTGVSWAPRDDFERTVSRLLVNFRVAQGWQDSRKTRKTAAQRESFPFRRDQRLARFRVGDGHRGGNEGTTRENSLIRISGRRVREIFGPGAVPINSVSLFASIRGEMPLDVPAEGDIPAGVFEVPILRYDLNGNGVVDDGDYFIAYVGGASDWGYNTGSRQFVYGINRYGDYRNYWLAAEGSGLTMERFWQPAAGSYDPEFETFEDNLFLRSPSFLSDDNNEGGLDWGWRKFTLARPDTTIRFELPGLDASQPGSLQLRRGRVYNESGSASISANLGQNALCASCASTGNTTIAVNSWDSRDLTIRYTNAALASRSYFELNWAHLRYRRFLSVSDASRRLEVFSHAESGVARYKLDNPGGGLVYVVRVPLDEREVSLVDTVRELSYIWNDEGNLGVRYAVALESGIIDYSDSLEAVVRGSAVGGKYQVADLRNAGNSTDYLIVAHDDFLASALMLAEHKECAGFARPRVALLSDVLDQFGGGNVDPAAIRNFLLYVYRHWDGGSEFSYVALLGAGHYDYKGVNSRAVNYMPVPYVNNRLSDDFYVFYDTRYPPGSQHDGYYFIGRLPARGSAEALDMVEKIIETEDPRAADFGAWRNRALLIADDDQQGDKEDGIKNHHISSDRVGNIIDKNRPDIDVRKLYLFEHAWDERFFKPSATRTLINEINGGVSFVSFFGHGAMDVLADERLLTRDDVPALNNRKRYPVIGLFSCSVGKFDHPGEESIAEVLIKQPRSGAVAAVAGARLVYDERNERLALPFTDALTDTAFGANLSIGSALTIAKHKYNDQQNRYYPILGDPSINLFGRDRGVSLSVTDTSGAPLDTLKALQRVTVKGTVTNAAGQRDAGFGAGGDSAFVSLTLFNPAQDSVRRKDGGRFSNPVYSLPGSPVFSGRIRVENGEFEQRLLLPMNLVFGKPGVKLTAYVWKERAGLTGAGHVSGLVFDGSESGGGIEAGGPRISVRPVYADASMNQAGMFVRNRVTAQLPLTLEIGIEAENGVNVMGTGPDEGLTAEIKGTLSKRSINHQFQFADGSFNRGSAMLTLEENMIRVGTHELIISAQDLLGNVSKLSVTLDIVPPAELKLDHAINVPNPVKMGRETRFYFMHSDAPGDLDVTVTIRIYSLGGRLLAVIRDPRNGHPWIPADQKGNLLTPNVYLYQITATSPNIGKTVKSKVKKLVVHPPR